MGQWPCLRGCDPAVRGRTDAIWACVSEKPTTQDDKTSMTTSADPKSTQSLLDRSLQIRKHLGMASVLKVEDGSWHGLIESNGEFPPEKGRYHLYIGRRTLVQVEE